MRLITFKSRDLRQVHEDFILHAISEKGVIRIAAQVLKWKHRDAFLRNHRGRRRCVPGQSIRYRSRRAQVDEQARYDKRHRDARRQECCNFLLPLPAARNGLANLFEATQVGEHFLHRLITLLLIFAQRLSHNLFELAQGLAALSTPPAVAPS